MSMASLDSQVYDIVMIAMTILGVVVNITSIIILQRKNRSTMFHTLLKVSKNTVVVYHFEDDHF